MFKHSILRHLSSTCVFAAPADGGAGGTATTKPKSSVPAAGKSPFAHLARPVPSAAEEKDEGEGDDEDDKEEKDASTEGDDDEEDSEDDDAKKSKKAKSTKKAKKAKKAEDDEECEEDDDAKAEDGDDDSDKDDDDDADARAARARERGRIRAIVTSSAGKLNPVGAMELACGTSMSRRQAIGVLHAMGAPAAAEPRKTDALRNRMAGVEAPDVGNDAPGGGGSGNPVKATAAAIVAAGKKRRGEKA